MLSSFVTYIVDKFLCGLALSFSIALSVGIELYTNPYVHRELNCPRIAQVPWSEYGFGQACKTGWICSWWLTLVAVILPASPKVYMALCLYNISIPLVMCIIQDPKPRDIYAGHNFMYAGNAIVLTLASIFQVGMLIYALGQASSQI